jgi:hypothetical protein
LREDLFFCDDADASFGSACTVEIIYQKIRKDKDADVLFLIHQARILA